MKKLVEITVALSTIAGCVAAVAFPFLFQRAALAENHHNRVITLTAVASQGVWTEEQVDGTNYWRNKFAPAQIVLHAGDTVTLRLVSSDVEHSMSLPELGIDDPVEVKPGQVSEITLHVDQPGCYIFMCATKCGHCHDSMIGSILVLADGDTPGMYPDPLEEFPPPPCPGHDTGIVDTGPVGG